MNDQIEGIFIAVGGVVTAFLGYLGSRFINKSARRASQDDWIERYRNGAEAHLMWDVDRRADILELRTTLNQLLIAAGKDPKTFGPIPDPPSLFPKAEQSASTKD